MDMIARSLQMDAVELRRQNLVGEGGEGVTGEHIHSFGLRECLDKVAEAIQWGSRSADTAGKSLARGKGLACLIKATITPSLSSAMIRLHEDGSATVYVGTVDMGQGSDTVMAQIASEELRIPLSKVHVVHSDTDTTPYDLTTSSSRSTFSMGRAVQLAAQDLRRQLACMAAILFKVSPEDIICQNQQVRPKGNGAGISYGALLARHYGVKGINLTGNGTLQTSATQKNGEPQTSAFWFAGAASAEVEVDRETGHVRVVRYAAAADVGKALNPFLCEQQLRGGSIMGIGQALMEQLVYQDGLLINPNFFDYNLPRFLDIPEQVISILVEQPHPEGPFGAKGLGENALIPAPAAIANAIEDAVGVRITSLPITPEKVFLALQQQRKT
jgi:CO/xanthine dehydrogenase Mo-binding subunit